MQQACHILREKNLDIWLTFARESGTNPDPMMEMIVGANCTWPSAFILTKDDKAIAIVGSLDVQNIKDHADYQVIGYVGAMREELLRTLNELNPQQIAINYSVNDVMADGLSHGMYLILLEYLQGTPYLNRLVSSEEIVAALRGRKSKTEIQRIKSAIEVTLAIFEQVTQQVHVGMTERQVADFIMYQVRQRGLEPAWDADHCPAVFTGPDSAGAHAGPTDREIEPGHIMNIDFGVRKDGYVSDLQRTWYFLREGERTPPESVQHGFATIRDAIRNAAAALSPGKMGWQVDQVARDYIMAAGYSEFPHALGHQVGRKAHDGAALLCPRWERYKNLPFLLVEAGQVYTLEPRLTVPGHGIATCEEIVLVTQTGCEFLSQPQDELIVIE